jgi:putative tryptophan/tyrosine transport system substrate-binding protein
MRRREFIAGLGGAAAWPVVARAQQSKMPVIGLIHAVTPDGQGANLASLRKSLSELGFVKGRNFTTEYRFARRATAWSPRP